MGDEQANASHEATEYRDTFISYAHQDATLARFLACALRERNVPVWYDEWELSRRLRGLKLFRALNAAVARADAMIVLDTEIYRARNVQKVPGSSLAHLMAPIDFPLDDAPILGRERNLWIQRRSPERILFKEIQLNVAKGGADSVLRRYAVYFGIIWSYGVRHREIARIDWQECHAAHSPNRGTLIGQEVHIEAQRLDTVLPLLLEELRTPTGSGRQQQNRALADLAVKEARKYSPARHELVGFEKSAHRGKPRRG